MRIRCSQALIQLSAISLWSYVHCRAARVVAWLEALAGEALDAEEADAAAGGGTAGRFGATEGVWAETRLRLAAGVAALGDRPLVRQGSGFCVCSHGKATRQNGLQVHSVCRT